MQVPGVQVFHEFSLIDSFIGEIRVIRGCFLPITTLYSLFSVLYSLLSHFTIPHIASPPKINTTIAAPPTTAPKGRLSTRW